MDANSKVNILIVDDAADKLLALDTVLADLGERVVTAASGREALRRLLADDFAVVLLDVNMPDLDGFETASLIRQRKRSEHTPIIFITADGDETHVTRGYSLGAVDYIVAPLLPEVLRTKVSVFVELYRKQREIERQADQRVVLALMQAERDEAERANRAKSEFLANVSHELRTPMNAIIGMTDLALQEPLTPSARDYLETARTSATLLVSLLNEILDFSKLDSGRFSLEAAPFDLRVAVQQTVKTLIHHAEAKNLRLDCDITEGVDMRVAGDSLRLRQVLNNLIGNAIKFTSQGAVTVSVRPVTSDDSNVSFQFAVRDTGIGISPEDQGKIFAPFTQVDASMTRRFGGAGLGLTIAANLVAMMGGQLHVESEPGSGSTFSFTIRLPRAASPPPPPTSEAIAAAPAKASAALCILLAEDTHANQKLITTVLRRRGHRVEVVSNGAEAVEAVRQGRYDVILMDIQMPIMDGFEATAAIRALAEPAIATVPIVALTAHAMQGDDDRCLMAGMDAYLAKPIDIRTLVDLVEELPHRARRTVPLEDE
jgi:signal transduction histidine kinase